jgi:hypothetical protein
MEKPRIEFDTPHRLAICRPAGQLDAGLAGWLLDFVLAVEEVVGEPFDRLLDVSNVAEVRISGHDLYELSQTRRAACVGRPGFRIAILAPDPIAYATARLYEALTEGCGVKVGVFRDADAAAAWLGVPRDVIRVGGA